MLLIILHRLLQSFIFPPLNAMLIIIMGLVLLKFYRKTATGLIIGGVFFLYIQSIPLTAYVLSKEIEPPPLSASELKTAQAIVILGGGIDPNGLEYPSGVSLSGGTALRLIYAAFLAKQYPNKLIVTSGGYTGSLREAKIMRDALKNDYKVKNPIILEDNSRNTDENAKFTANILLPMHIKNVVVVTQAFHMRRAVMLFRKYGLNPIAASTGYYSDKDALTPALFLIPNSYAMSQVTLILHEIVGSTWYRP